MRVSSPATVDVDLKVLLWKTQMAVIWKAIGRQQNHLKSIFISSDMMQNMQNKYRSLAYAALLTFQSETLLFMPHFKFLNHSL